MVNVAYQVVFNNNIDIVTELSTLLKEALDENYVQYDEDNSIFVHVNYQIEIDIDKSLLGFQFSFDNIDGDLINIISSFNDKLNDNENMAVAFKFYDKTLFESLIKLYEELFDIEMRLREAITLIFVDTYKDDFYNLLYEIDVPVQMGLNKHLHKNKEQREQFLSKRLENEFYHILFSDYVKLTKPKTLKQDDLFLIAELSNNFEEFKNNILKRGVIKEEYLEFINSIKESMNNLEKIRNCVAHNRNPSEDEFYNYTLSKESFDTKLQDFFEKLNVSENGA